MATFAAFGERIGGGMGGWMGGGMGGGRGCGFSSLMKQKIKGKNCAVFYFAGKSSLGRSLSRSLALARSLSLARSRSVARAASTQRRCYPTGRSTYRPSVICWAEPVCQQCVCAGALSLSLASRTHNHGMHPRTRRASSDVYCERIK